MERGILGWGAYVPTLRIDRAAIAAANAWAFPSRRGRGARALASWDEDVITMAVEASRGLGHGEIGALTLASTTAPFADLQNAALVSSALALGPAIETADAGGSLRAGSSALIKALRANDETATLLVAADARRARPGSTQELQYGAGAVALKIGAGPVVARLLASSSRSEPFFDHFRAATATYDYYWEDRWIRDEGILKMVPEAVQATLDKAGIAAADIAHFCFPTVQGGAAAAVARKLGIAGTAVADDLSARCGDTGTAHGPLMLASALERASPGDKLLLVTFASGCDIMLFEATEALASYRPARSVAAAVAGGRIDTNYTRLLSFQGELALDWGMRSEGAEKVSLTQQFRAREQLASFTAGQCPECDTVQFPQLASCVNCGSFAPLSPRSLVDEPARAVSFTADWLAYHPAPPLYFGLVQFDNGARVLMEIVDVDPAELEIGTPLRMVYRIKSHDSERNYTRYFWKATPHPVKEI